MDIDNLGPGPDLDSIDISKLDRGDSLDTDPPVDEKKVDEPPVDEQKADEPPVDEPPVDEQKADEPKSEGTPRDASGKFVKKERAVPDYIPKDRFDEAVNKEREAREAAEKRAAEAEARLREREQAAAVRAERSSKIAELDAQIDALEAQRYDAIMDGEKDRVAELNKNIRDLYRQVAKLEAQEESSAIINETLEKERMQAIIARFEADYPELNPRSEMFDKDLIDMILPLQYAKVQQGMQPSAALVEAVEKVMQRVKAAKTAESDAGLSNAHAATQTVTDARRTEQVAKAIEASKKQPPTLQNVGADTDKAGEKGLPDVSRMTVEEFSALPEAIRARLRGDLLAA